MNLSLGWVDWWLLGALLLSTLLGALRGLVFEVLALAGWFVAYFAAGWIAPSLAPHLPLATSGAALNSAAAFVIAFIAVLIVWGLGARLIRTLVHSTPLRPGDRLLGAVFGVLRGIVVLLVVTLAVGFTPIARSSAWAESAGASALNALLRSARPMLPSYLSPLLPAAA